jgi:hypothetical protein
MNQSDSINELATALSAAQAEMGGAASVGWWKMPGFSKYLIGDSGDVCTLRGRPRLMKPIRAGSNYFKVILVADDGAHHHRYIHSLVAACFGRDREDGEQTRHLDGNTKNNSIENLAYGTPTENAADKVRHGTDPAGERNGMAKLTAGQVKSIRSLLGSRPQSHIARDFGVSPMTISRIANKHLWRSV